MPANKMEMTLDEIIKSSRKASRETRGKPANKKAGNKNTPKKNGGNAKVTKKNGGVKKTGVIKKAGGIQKRKNTAPNEATKRLVQKLVSKALAKRSGGVARNVTKKMIKSPRSLQQRSVAIKKAPRTETVVVTRRVVKAAPARRVTQAPTRQVIREVVVEEPVRYAQPQQRRVNSNRPRTQVVYVEKSGGGRGTNQGYQQRRRFGQKRAQATDPWQEPTNWLLR